MVMTHGSDYTGLRQLHVVSTLSVKRATRLVWTPFRSFSSFSLSFFFFCAVVFGEERRSGAVKDRTQPLPPVRLRERSH
ncbi:hypothetical protein F2P81_013007 [Scophthalmus maximus]|uniref:Transmembrane protein n=1 Tax=Scophthalmus maximus TaxID=52904 RepID=A0A6A4SRE6_SCOMX|nr:hypothetical protein F2P81_013007 [Scophthalmus maximus]